MNDGGGIMKGASLHDPTVVHDPIIVWLLSQLDVACADYEHRHMTSDSDVPHTGAELYRTGPWVVVYGHGLESEDAATRVCEQCSRHNVDTECHAIDQVAAKVRSLANFLGLVVVLPSACTPSLPAELKQSADLIISYRARRPEGLESLLNRDCRWYEAGVIHVLGLHGFMSHPRIRSALARSCARYYLDYPSRSFDVFKIYTGQNVPSVKPPEPETIKELWRYLESWGLTNIKDIPRMLTCIDSCREYYEDPRFPQLYRPVPGYPGNRLDIILEGPPDLEAGDHKTWMENGARVWRHVQAQLRDIEPDFGRPEGLNAKGAQAALRDFYLTLKIMDRYMRDSDESDWPSTPS